MLTRDEVALIQQRTGLINQLQSALAEYYPTALAAFNDWTCPATWAFVEKFPTPEALVKAGPQKWEKFLRPHQLWREATCQKRLNLLGRTSRDRSILVPSGSLRRRSDWEK